MSTLPSPAQTAKPPVTPGVVSTFLKAHETLIIILVLAVVTFFGYSKAINYLSAHDALINNKAQVTLQAQIDANKQSADTTAQLVSRYSDLVTELIASNAKIAAAQTQRAQVTQKQQAVDKTLPPPELAARWNTLLKMPSGVSPDANGYTATPDAAVATVTQLELVPQLQADLAGQQMLTSNGLQQIGGLTAINNSQAAEIAGLGTQIQDQTKACVAQVNSIKAAARKSKLHWFEFGFVTGFLARQFIKTETGV